MHQAPYRELGTALAGTKPCEGGLYEGFVADTLRVAYGHGTTLANEPMEDLRGYRHPTTALVTVALTDNEDDYEVLAKSIAKYNGSGPRVNDEKINWFETRSWPRLLRYLDYDPKSTKNTATVCHSCRYSLQVRDKDDVFAGHLRTYIWQGGTYPATKPDGAPHPQAGQEWCFAYGEKEWRNPLLRADGQPATWRDYRNFALADEDLQIPCR